MARETVTSVRSSLSSLFSLLSRSLSGVGLSHRSLKIKPAPDSLPVRVKVTTTTAKLQAEVSVEYLLKSQDSFFRLILLICLCFIC